MYLALICIAAGGLHSVGLSRRKSAPKLCYKGAWIMDDVKLEVEQYGTLQLSGNAKIFIVVSYSTTDCGR